MVFLRVAILSFLVFQSKTALWPVLGTHPPRLMAVLRLPPVTLVPTSTRIHQHGISFQTYKQPRTLQPFRITLPPHLGQTISGTIHPTNTHPQFLRLRQALTGTKSFTGVIGVEDFNLSNSDSFKPPSPLPPRPYHVEIHAYPVEPALQSRTDKCLYVWHRIHTNTCHKSAQDTFRPCGLGIS